MKVEKTSNDEAVIYLGEKINIVNSPELKKKMQELFDQEVKLLFVDFTDTKMIDSSCLGKILMFQKKLKETGGELVIRNVTSEYIRKMFYSIQLNKVIRILP